MATNTNYDSSKYYTVKDALRISGYSNAHLRMGLLKTGKIDSIKENISGTSIPRILIDRKSFDAYLASHPRNASASQLSEEQIACLQKNGLWTE
jgi:hypothetical protein